MQWVRLENIVGGLGAGHNFVARKTEHVVAKEVLVPLPTGTVMVDTECRSACGGHDFHASLQATMDSFGLGLPQGEAGGVIQMHLYIYIYTYKHNLDGKQSDLNLCGCTRLESW